MEQEHGVETEPRLDTFGLLLPLPYRVAVILVAGFWGWGLNLHYLSLVKIDVPSLIRYPSRPSVNHKSHHVSTYHLASLLSTFLAVSILLFWIITHGSPKLVVSWEILPQSYLFLFTVLIVLPFHRLSRSGRHRFLVALKRISVGGLAEAQDGKFGDILLADALTSYAKVIGDLFVNGCMFFSSTTSSCDLPDRSCGGDFMVPLLTSIPNLIRLRQCLIEFFRVRRAGNKSDGWGGQHLANALKYSTAFPVIILTAMQRNYDPSKIGMSQSGLYRLWILSALLNSFYSYYWDITKDWDLTLFSPTDRNNPNYPFALRRNRYFHAKEIYYSAMIIDLILRFTWVIKLSPLDRINDFESGIFLLMFLEVARRWMWIFLRVETEWGPNQNDIPLADVNGKIDED
ncbi:protein-ER retention protein [Arachnomyces sp. PD_36]|nr:protein-ER retention protein [Arachnomyces sp. PD_36]